LRGGKAVSRIGVKRLLGGAVKCIGVAPTHRNPASRFRQLRCESASHTTRISSRRVHWAARRAQVIRPGTSRWTKPCVASGFGLRGWTPKPTRTIANEKGRPGRGHQRPVSEQQPAVRKSDEWKRTDTREPAVWHSADAAHICATAIALYRSV